MNKNDKMTLMPRFRFPEFKSAAIGFENGNMIFEPISNKNHDSDLPVLAITQEHGAIPRDQIDYNVSVTDKSLESYKVVEIGDFIISLRSFQGGIEYSLYHGICSPAYIILRKSVPIVEQYYKHYFKTERFIQDLNKDLEGIRDGKMVSYSQFSAIMLPKPDRKEQQKIADCLSSLDDLIAEEGKKLDAFKAHKKGLMQKLFPAEGKTLPEWRFPEFRNSGEWEETNIGKICSVLQGYGFPETMQGKHTGKYPFCKVSDISIAVFENGGKLSKAVNYINDVELNLLNAKLIPAGATVFAKIGEALRLNRRAITSIDCVIDNNAVGLMALDKSIPDYFIFCISQLIDLGMYCGGAVPSINKSILESIKITLPSTAPEQQKIADCLSSIDGLITEQAKKIEALRSHKKGLMQGLFPSIEEVSE
jgi:type I restriction enzyme S subunit